MLTRVWDALHKPHDGPDRTLQDLLKGFGTEHFEVAMYQALEAFARTAGDAVTARLAAEHLWQEQEAAERLRHFIAPTAARAAAN
jgi:ferritin-like metal-binding protein YciE